MRYVILHATTVQDLEIQTNEYTLNSWELYGNLVVTADGTLYQCVVRRIPKSGKPVELIEEPPYGPNVKAVGPTGALDFIRNK